MDQVYSNFDTLAVGGYYLDISKSWLAVGGYYLDIFKSWLAVGGYYLDISKSYGSQGDTLARGRNDFLDIVKVLSFEFFGGIKSIIRT